MTDYLKLGKLTREEFLALPNIKQLAYKLIEAYAGGKLRRYDLSLYARLSMFYLLVELPEDEVDDYLIYLIELYKDKLDRISNAFSSFYDRCLEQEQEGKELLFLHYRHAVPRLGSFIAEKSKLTLTNNLFYGNRVSNDFIVDLLVYIHTNYSDLAVKLWETLSLYGIFVCENDEFFDGIFAQLNSYDDMRIIAYGLLNNAHFQNPRSALPQNEEFMTMYNKLKVYRSNL